MNKLTIQSVAIIGLGALGLTYADLIGKNNNVDLQIVADATRISKYQTTGVFINDVKQNFNYVVDSKAKPVDLIIFAVKFKQLDSAIYTARNLVGENTTIISVLNGVTSEKILAKAFGASKLLLTTVQGMDSTKIGNNLSYSKLGNFKIGINEQGDAKRLAAVAEFLNSEAIAYTICDDMEMQLWNKWVLNVGVNQVLAVRKGSYKDIKKDGPYHSEMVKAMEEAVLVAKAEKIALPDDTIAQWLKVVETLTDDKMPSMRQDSFQNRPNEVDLFAKMVIDLGNKHHLPVEENKFLYQELIKYNK